MSQSPEKHKIKAAEFFSDKNILKSFLDSISDIVFLLDSNGCYLKIITSKDALLIKEEKNLLGKPFAEILPSEVAVQCMRALKTALQTDKCQTIEYALEVPAGTRWFDCRVIPMTSQQTQEKTVLWLAKEITETKNNQKVIAQQEQERNLILNSIPDMLAYLSCEREILWANETSKKQHRSHTCITGQHCYTAWFNKNSPCSECPMQKALETKKPQTAQITFPDGNTWLMTSSPVINCNGEIDGILEHGQNITQSIKTTQRMQLTDQRLKLAIAAANEAAWEWEPNKHPDITKECADMLGYTLEEYPESLEEWLKLVHPSDLPLVRQHINTLMSDNEKVFKFEFRIKRKDGFWTWIRSSGKVIDYDEKGKPSKIIGINLDITEQKKMQETLIKSRTDAEFLISELESEAKLNTKKMLEALEKNNAKNNLLINTSHELRTEINAVNGFVELLNQEPLSENATFYLKTLNQNCQTLSALIDNLTDSIILETGRPTLTARFFNLNDFLEELATTAFFLEKQSNAKLKLSVDKTAKTSVKTDKEKLRRVLHILCSNLMGLDPIEDIELKLNQDSSQNLNFSIQCKTNTTDDAPKKLLQDEMMLPASYTQNAFQNKKGLTIAKTLVNVLGGILSFENAEQKCCFKFTIPQQNIDTEMNEDISNSHLPATLPTSKKESAEPEQMLILIVEDNANSLLLTKTMLKRLHYRTLSAKTPSQALHIIENVNIDAILMDVQLPEINGFDVTQQIRRLEKSKKRRKVPIIALTAYAFENDKQHCLDNGMDDFIAKPIDMTKLKTVLGSLL